MFHEKSENPRGISYNPAVDLSSSSDSDYSPGAVPVSPAVIFRESTDIEFSNDNSGLSVPSVLRANPIRERSIDMVEEEDDDDYDGRVISPYPYRPDEIEEHEEHRQLATSLRWKKREAGEDYQTEQEEGHSSVMPDYSRFFELEPYSQHQRVMEICHDDDDFSISSHEANSITEDFSFGGIAQDANSFWEGVLVQANSFGRNEEGRSSPAQVSLQSGDL